MHKREERRDKKRREVREKSAPPRPRLRSHRGVGTDPPELWHHLSSVMQRKKGVKALASVETSVETSLFALVFLKCKNCGS